MPTICDFSFLVHQQQVNERIEFMVAELVKLTTKSLVQIFDRLHSLINFLICLIVDIFISGMTELDRHDLNATFIRKLGCIDDFFLRIRSVQKCCYKFVGIVITIIRTIICKNRIPCSMVQTKLIRGRILDNLQEFFCFCLSCFYWFR